MILFNWWLAGWLILALLMVVGGVFGLRLARKVPVPLLRVIVRIAASGSALLGLLVTLLLWAGSGCSGHSAPIYSPSRSMAVRIENLDEGATGGSTQVELYWAHGLRSKTVYSGEWASVEPSDIHWEGNSRLTIQIRDASSDYSSRCASAGGVKVECSPRPLR